MTIINKQKTISCDNYTYFCSHSFVIVCTHAVSLFYITRSISITYMYTMKVRASLRKTWLLIFIEIGKLGF